MICDQVRRDLSAQRDGEPVEPDAEHLATCASCAAFERGMRSLRTALRFEVVDDAPDVTAAVMARIPVAIHRRRRMFVPAAAALVAGIVAGATFAWPARDGSDVAIASLPARILVAQDDVASLAADLSVTESGRTRTGTIRYRAPETIELRLGDDVLAMSDGAWTLTAPGHERESVTGAEPFADGSPLPLDLVLPAAAFAGASEPNPLGTRTIDGHAAVGVRVTAAQVTALLDGLRPGGDGREIHPTDTVDLWLDRDDLVPLDVVVRAAGGPDRARWAAARGYRDRAGDVVLEAYLRNLAVNDALAVDGLTPPVVDGATDAGFRDHPISGPAPSWLPPGMRRWRTGSVGDVAVRTWTDGRAWLKVSSTTSWTDTRLFGDLGAAVHRVDVGRGVGYSSEDASSVAIHAPGLDVVVTGSVGPSTVLRVAASMGITGVAVPSTWDEATTSSVAGLRRVLDVLVLPSNVGFAPPAARLDGAVGTLFFAGPGARGLVLATRRGGELTPPLDPDAVGVVVRGRAARWSPSRGELEWVERGQLWSLRSTTVSLAELVHLTSLLRSP